MYAEAIDAYFSEHLGERWRMFTDTDALLGYLQAAVPEVKDIQLRGSAGFGKSLFEVTFREPIARVGQSLHLLLYLSPLLREASGVLGDLLPQGQDRLEDAVELVPVRQPAVHRQLPRLLPGLAVILRKS